MVVLSPERKNFRVSERFSAENGEGGWKARKSNGQAWKISIKQIQERNYNLDFKNPNGKAKIEHTDPKEVLENIAKTESHIAKILEEIKKEI
ncbi:hypothetical protein HZB04_02620 [Candidatus Wolfebacteria bacterium]|nr:hypothetical protein [Candidatus Wolfebacteria bacterium]